MKNAKIRLLLYIACVSCVCGMKHTHVGMWASRKERETESKSESEGMREKEREKERERARTRARDRERDRGREGGREGGRDRDEKRWKTTASKVKHGCFGLKSQ